MRPIIACLFISWLIGYLAGAWTALLLNIGFLIGFIIGGWAAWHGPEVTEMRRIRRERK